MWVKTFVSLIHILTRREIVIVNRKTKNQNFVLFLPFVKIKIKKGGCTKVAARQTLGNKVPFFFLICKQIKK